VKVETMANDVAKGEQVYYEEERTKHQTLGTPRDSGAVEEV